MPDDLREGLEEDIAKLKALPPPRSIAELLEHNGEEGTHSIIDIEQVSSGPGFGVA